MTPKEKAEELMDKYWELNVDDKAPVYTDTCKQCALIAVDELLDISLPSSEYGGVITNNTIEYWQEVRNEIEKL